MLKEVLKEEGYSLVGAAFEVYNELGGGLLEEVYQQALEIELEIRNIPYESQIMNYLRLTNLNVGYLINFGNTEKLDWKRFILT